MWNKIPKVNILNQHIKLIYDFPDSIIITKDNIREMGLYLANLGYTTTLIEGISSNHVTQLQYTKPSDLYRDYPMIYSIIYLRDIVYKNSAGEVSVMPFDKFSKLQPEIIECV